MPQGGRGLGDQSPRSTRLGSTSAARRAGSHDAASAALSKIADTVAKVATSKGETPNQYGRCRSESNANAKLLSPSQHAVRDHAVQADDRQRKRDNREHTK